MGGYRRVIGELQANLQLIYRHLVILCWVLVAPLLGIYWVFHREIPNKYPTNTQ